MEEVLFDNIHDSFLYEDRTLPATLNEFIDFGLSPMDYVEYIGLTLKLQGTVLLGHTKTDPRRYSRELDEVLKEFLMFCDDRKLICKPYTLHYFDILQAAIRWYDSLQYIQTSETFRLEIERRLSSWWDDLDLFIVDVLYEKFGILYFDRGCFAEYPNGDDFIFCEGHTKIYRWDKDTKERVYLRYKEVKKIYEFLEIEMKQLEKKIYDHENMSVEIRNGGDVDVGLDWINTLSELNKSSFLLEEIFEDVSDALKTLDVYNFRETDILYVICGDDICLTDNHHISEVRVNFSFYGKDDKEYVIKRCSDCMRYQISIDELTMIFDNYGVIRAQIIYVGADVNDFSGFDSTSVFYDMGYTVSASVGLTASRRQKILVNVINSGVATKHEVLAFLRQRMNINGMKSGNELAYKKWKEDYEFIRKL
ncbi:MAG: hypothetical protein E7218_05580 [Anaerofustis stercorihominis]|nr:hypothetical protein [Anaerofustis stercorihominis]